VLRYLRAFGPATVADMSSWSGLSRLREVFEQLRPGWRTFRDEDSRELFDVPDGPLPDPDTPAPVRFLPFYDNVLLGHADRRRIVSEEHRRRAIAEPGAAFLVDGFVAGTWRILRKGKAATLSVRPYRKLTRSEQAAIGTEGAKLMSLISQEAESSAVQWDSGR
jgi:hypothetical protein